MEPAGKPWIEDRKEVPHLALPVVTPRVAADTGRLVDWAQFQGLVFDRPASDPDGWTCRLEEYLVDPADVQDPGGWRTRIALKLADEPPFQNLTDNSATASEPT